MPTPPIAREILENSLKHWEAASGSVAKACETAGIARSTLQAHIAEAKRRLREHGSLDVPPRDLRSEIGAANANAEPVPEKDTEAWRQTAHNAKFWQRRAKDLERQLEEVENIARELGGIREVPTTPPDWIVRPSRERHGAVVGCFLSDFHCGEVVRADEIEGINAYDVDVFRARLRRYIAAVINIAPRWLADCEPAGCLLALGGDLISGDIHEELRVTNALTSHEQVQVCVEELTTAIRHLVEAFGSVHVPCVPGNHGRTTPKPTAKLAARLSYDTLIGSMLADRFAGDERVTFDVASGPDCLVRVFGWRILLTHGDRLGTGGGQGFAGPFLPIVRGGKKVLHQHASMRRPYDLLMTGHYHTSGQPGAHLSNGSMVGYSEYPNGIRAAVEPPMQWAFLLHERWLLRDRAEIKLEELAAHEVEKPRIRVPAGRAAA